MGDVVAGHAARPRGPRPAPGDVLGRGHRAPADGRAVAGAARPTRGPGSTISTRPHPTRRSTCSLSRLPTGSSVPTGRATRHWRSKRRRSSSGDWSRPISRRRVRSRRPSCCAPSWRPTACRWTGRSPSRSSPRTSGRATGRRRSGLGATTRCSAHAPPGSRFDLRSPNDVRSLLRRIGIEVPDTRAWRLEAMQDAHPLIPALLAWRKAERIGTAFGYSWLDAHLGADGRLRGEWTGSDGAAGRMTATAGLHNMPAELRPAVQAEPGHVFVRADLGQIEPRVLAAVSGDRALATATADADMYAPVARQLGVDRAVAKVAVLGAMYGQTTGRGAEALRGLERAYPVAMAYLTRRGAAGRRRAGRAHRRRPPRAHGRRRRLRRRRARGPPPGQRPRPLRPQRRRPGRRRRAVQDVGPARARPCPADRAVPARRAARPRRRH